MDTLVVMQMCWVKFLLGGMHMGSALFIPPGYKEFNFYELLEVSHNATKTEITDNYMKLSASIHRKAVSEEKKERDQAKLKFAYDLLSDKDKREEYDEYLSKQESTTTAQKSPFFQEDWEECESNCKHGTCQELEGEQFILSSVMCVCDSEKAVQGEWCDKEVVISERCKKECKPPSQCIHLEQLDSKIASTLSKHGNIYGDAANATGYKEHVKTEVLRVSFQNFVFSGDDNQLCFCSLGYRERKCNKRCKKGYYGLYCLTQCDPECSESCNAVNGKCKCRHGFVSGVVIPSICVPVPLTEENCAELCKFGSCDGAKCICDYAREPYCDVECSKLEPYPRYGKTCENSCGGCRRLPCNKETGVCPKPRLRGRSRCITKEFVGKKCELGGGVVITSRMVLSVRKKVSQKRLKNLILKILVPSAVTIILGTGVLATFLPTLVLAIPAVAATATFAIVGGIGVYLYNKFEKHDSLRTLLQITETDQFEADISLPMPAGSNSSVYKDLMQQILEKVADDFETDPSSGISVDRESIQVTNVQPFEVDLSNSEMDTMPVVIGGLILAAVTVLCIAIALVMMKRKASQRMQQQSTITTQSLARYNLKCSSY